MTINGAQKKPLPKGAMQRRLAASNIGEPAPIVPAGTVTGRALITVIAIMTFLAAITAASITLVQDATTHWRSDLAREITIQIRAREGANVAAETAKVAVVANNFPGLADVRILSAQETGRMLEPWLGRGLELDTLPVPGIIVARIRDDVEPDLDSLRVALKKEVPNASLDDHRGWSARLSAMSDGVLFGGALVLLLVLASTALSVIFATRSAVSGNRAIVEVLHFVGARDSFIATVFQKHFLIASLKGALAGGIAAAALFAIAAITPDFLSKVPGTGNTAALIGQLMLQPAGYMGIAVVVLMVVIIATVAARVTVFRTIRSID